MWYGNIKKATRNYLPLALIDVYLLWLIDKGVALMQSGVSIQS